MLPVAVAQYFSDGIKTLIRISVFMDDAVFLHNGPMALTCIPHWS